MARAKSASSSRASSSNSRATTGSSSRASSAASKGSKKGKAALKLMAKAERLHDNATEFIEKGDSKAGLKELAKLIRLHAKHHKKALAKKKEPTLPPAWEIAEEYAMTANSEMVFRAAAMDAQQDVQWLSREALRFVGGAGEDEGSGSKSPGSSTSSMGRAKAAKKAAPNYLVGQNPLKKSLKAMILNNQAVQRWVAEEPLANVISLLQRALSVSEGVFCSLVLYNLAVAFMACGRFEDTTETVARCLELTNGYLQQVKPPSMRQLLEEEEAANRPKSTPLKKKGKKGASPPKKVSAAPPPSRPSPSRTSSSSKKKGGKKKKAAPVVVPLTEEELAEIARQERLAELRRRWKIYSTFIVTMASHTILCHHVIATLAVWCGMEGTEQYHCELAMGCAKKYLPCSHPMQKRCKDRLHNITNSSLPRIKPHGGIPPQLPLMTQADFIATPCAAAAQLPEEESPFPCAAGASKMPPVKLSQLLTLATSVAKPQELVDFIKAMAAEAKRAKKAGKKTPKGRSRSASLPILRPGSRQSNPGSARGKRRKSASAEKALMLERLPPAVHEDPPVGENGPQFVTKVPRIAYERYEHLKENTIHYLATSGVITPEAHVVHKEEAEKPLGAGVKVGQESVLPGISKIEKRRESMIMDTAAKLGRANGAQVPPPELMVQYDTDLRRMSHLVKDLMPEVRFRAAQMIQRQWKYYAAHLELERRKKAIQDWMTRATAASDILYYYRRWKERLPAILEARELRRQRTRALQLAKIQAFLYQMQSVEEWGRRCAALYERLLEEKRQREKENAAATMIQSVWRMYKERLNRRGDYAAATKIQTQWRCRKAREALLMKRVHRKLMYEAFLRSVEDRIVYIQRWYRACQARRAVAGLLDSKKKEIEDYLRREEDWFDKELGHLMDDPNLEAKIRKIMSVLRGAKARSELHTQWKSRNIINEALGKYALRKRGTLQLAALREEKATRDALARRREEVNDAATQIQALVRQRQARRRAQTLRECFAMMDDAARCIQRAFAKYRRDVALSELSERTRLQQEAKDFGKLRQFAATRIQAVWRGRKERQEQAAFLEFMRHHRHRLARRIQCAWRLYKARSSTAKRTEMARAERTSEALHRRQCVAAARIAAVFRMYHVRKTLAAAGHKLPPTKYILFNSARKIQCAWRRYASCSYVQQVRLAVAYRDTEKASQEALHAYATLIQSIVRGRILNRRRVGGLKPRGGADGDEKEPRVREEKGAGCLHGEEKEEKAPVVDMEPVVSVASTTLDEPAVVEKEEKVIAEEEPTPSVGEATIVAPASRNEEESHTPPEKPDSSVVSGCLSSGSKKNSSRRIRFILPGEDELRTTDTSTTA